MDAEVHHWCWWSGGPWEHFKKKREYKCFPPIFHRSFTIRRHIMCIFIDSVFYYIYVYIYDLCIWLSRHNSHVVVSENLPITGGWMVSWIFTDDIILQILCMKNMKLSNVGPLVSYIFILWGHFCASKFNLYIVFFEKYDIYHFYSKPLPLQRPGFFPPPVLLKRRAVFP